MDHELGLVVTYIWYMIEKERDRKMDHKPNWLLRLVCWLVRGFAPRAINYDLIFGLDCKIEIFCEFSSFEVDDLLLTEPKKRISRDARKMDKTVLIVEKNREGERDDGPP